MLRRFGLVMSLAATALVAAGQEPPVKEFTKRYNIEFNPINFPQKTPQEAMKSIAKALDAGRLDYMLAQLVEPKYVDPRVAEYLANVASKEEIQAELDDIARELDKKTQNRKIAAKEVKDKARVVVAFQRLVLETRKNFDEDPVLLKELRQFAKSADWEVDDDRATGSLKDATPRRIVLRKREDRWFMEERYQ